MITALVLSAVLALAAHPWQACEWKDPGHDPFMGDVVAAVDDYTDIPADTRKRLKKRMASRDYDDMVSIKRDSIEGSTSRVYGSELNSMHYGAKGRMCGPVSRASWTPKMEERGLVYCEDKTCIIVPTVCRNVSRLERYEDARDTAPPAPPIAEVPPTPPPIAENVPTVPPGPFAGPPEPVPQAFDSPPGDSTPGYYAGPPIFVGGGGYFGGGGGGGGGGFVGCDCVPPVPVDCPPDVPGTPAAPVPEPYSWVGLIVGLVTLKGYLWHRRKRLGLSRLSTK